MTEIEPAQVRHTFGGTARLYGEPKRSKVNLMSNEAALAVAMKREVAEIKRQNEESKTEKKKPAQTLVNQTRDLMSDGRWRTTTDVAAALGVDDRHSIGSILSRLKALGEVKGQKHGGNVNLWIKA